MLSRHFLLIIAAVTLLFGLLGALIGATRSDDFTARASVTLGPERPAVFAVPEDGAGGGDPEQYVESQVDVIGSLEVARRAASILAEGAYTPSADEVAARSEVARTPESTEIVVTYAADEGSAAVAGANAVIDGYQELMRQRWADTYTSAMESVNESLAVAEAETQSLLDQVQPAPEDEETNLTEQMMAIIEELRVIDQAVREGATAEGLAALEVRRGILATEVDAFETVFAEQLEGSQVSATASRLDAALVREARLRERLIELEVDSRLDGDGVVFATPAEAASESAAGPLLSGIAGLVLGAFVGLAIAYWLHGDLTRIESPADAQRVLGYPLLSVVHPHPGPGDLDASEPAEQISPQLLAAIRSRADGREPQVLGVIGVDEAPSRTSTAVRLGWASADDGLNVLVVDGNLDRTAWRDGLATSTGLTDFMASGMPLASFVEPRKTPDGNEFHVLGYGQAELGHSLSTGDLRHALDQVKGSYDVVVVDLPMRSMQELIGDGFSPLTCLLVVEHESRVKPVRRFMRGFQETEVEPVGFVYAFDGSSETVVEESGRRI